MSNSIRSGAHDLVTCIEANTNMNTVYNWEYLATSIPDSIFPSDYYIPESGKDFSLYRLKSNFESVIPHVYIPGIDLLRSKQLGIFHSDIDRLYSKEFNVNGYDPLRRNIDHVIITVPVEVYTDLIDKISSFTQDYDTGLLPSGADRNIVLAIAGIKPPADEDSPFLADKSSTATLDLGMNITHTHPCTLENFTTCVNENAIEVFNVLLLECIATVTCTDSVKVGNVYFSFYLDSAHGILTHDDDDF